jgi:hypothetical protein
MLHFVDTSGKSQRDTIAEVGMQTGGHMNEHSSSRWALAYMQTVFIS